MLTGVRTYVPVLTDSQVTTEIFWFDGLSNFLRYMDSLARRSSAKKSLFFDWLYKARYSEPLDVLRVPLVREQVEKTPSFSKNTTCRKTFGFWIPEDFFNGTRGLRTSAWKSCLEGRLRLFRLRLGQSTIAVRQTSRSRERSDWDFAWKKNFINGVALQKVRITRFVVS